MQALNIIVFQHDPSLAQALASTLSLHYHSVQVADSLQELRLKIPRRGEAASRIPHDIHRVYASRAG